MLTLKFLSFTKSAVNPFPMESVDLGSIDSVTLGGCFFCSSSLTFYLKSQPCKPLFQFLKEDAFVIVAFKGTQDMVFSIEGTQKNETKVL